MGIKSTDTLENTNREVGQFIAFKLKGEELTPEERKTVTDILINEDWALVDSYPIGNIIFDKTTFEVDFFAKRLDKEFGWNV